MTISKPKQCLCCVLLAAGFILSSPTVNAQIFTPNYPDTCTMQSTTDGASLEWYMTDFGTQVSIYGKAAMTRPGRYKAYPVVVIINGNDVDHSEYIPLANHLVLNQYVVIQINRKGTNVSNDLQLNDILDVMADLYSEYRIHSSSPVAFVGHSVGGGVAMKLSRMVEEQNRPFNVQAVSTLAPNPKVFIQEGNKLTAFDTPAYLGLYGSQDGDMTGMTFSQDAFTAYDHVGNERSTADAFYPNQEGELFKSMIYIHGADHMGLIGSDSVEGNGGVNYPFIATEDQFCITKAYLTAFLHWRLQNKILYKSYLTPPYVYTQSVQNITSELPDYMGYVAATNPAGSPLRMFFQTSPVQRMNIQNFESTWINSYEVYENFGWLFKTNQLFAFLLQDDQYNTSPFYIRNVTKKLLVAWENINSWQHLGFNLSGQYQDASDFTHVSVRTAQVWNDSFPEYVNPPGEYQEAYMVLVDNQGKQAFAKLDYWGDIPFNDVRSTGSSAHTGMNTISIPLSAFNQLNKSAITKVGIVFKPNTSGMILLDNLEWVKY